MKPKVPEGEEWRIKREGDIDEQLDEGEGAEFRCRLTEQMLTLQKDYDYNRQREAWQRSREMDRNRRIRKLEIELQKLREKGEL